MASDPVINITSLRDFSDGPAARTPSSRSRRPRFGPWAGNEIPTVILQATTKCPSCRNKDGRSCRPQLRLGAAKLIHYFKITTLNKNTDSSHVLKAYAETGRVRAHFCEPPNLGSQPHVKSKWKSLSCVQLFMTQGLYGPWNSPGQNTRVGSHSLLQGIFPTQGSNPGLLHCRWILYQLSYEGSPWDRYNHCLHFTHENWG